MPVRLIKPFNGQAANTLYWGDSGVAMEGVLRATGIADDAIDQASDYAPGQRVVTTAAASVVRAATIYRMNSATAQTLTMRASGFWPVGTVLSVVQAGAGATTITGETGVTIAPANGATSLTTNGVNSVVTLTKTGATSWIASGGLGGAPTLGALSLQPTAVPVGQPTTILIGGASYGSAITGTVPSGWTINSAARTITTSAATTGAFSLTETLAGATGNPGTTAGTLTQASSGGGGGGPVLTAFYLNGSTNPVLRAAMARVKAGTGTMTMTDRGDSTYAGEGAGSAGSNGALVVNARQYRPAARRAAALTAAGYKAFDAGVTGDQGIGLVGAPATLPQYDPRVSGIANGPTSTPTWGTATNNNWTGGGLLAGSTGRFTYTPDFACDTFEIVVYNSTAGGTLTIDIDGAAPSTGPSSYTYVSSTGFTKITVKAAVGTHTLGLVSSAIQTGAIRSVIAYDSTQPSIRILCQAVRGGTAATQDISNGNWYNIEGLKFDAPDLTLIKLGLNDMSAAVSPSSFTADLQNIITAAKVSGDVLLIFPLNGGAKYSDNVDAMNTAAKNLAASNSIAFMSFYEQYGSNVPQTPAILARFGDGIVHPNAGLYDEMAQLEAQAILRMIA